MLKESNVTDRGQSESERLHHMLTQKSSSRIGRLNKNTQQIAIKQLINEDAFTQDFKRKVEKWEGKVKTNVKLKKDIKVEELVRDRNVQNEREVINEMLRQLKKKNLKFSTFDKDLVLGLHRKKDGTEAVLEKKLKENLDQEKQEDIPFNEFFEIDDKLTDDEVQSNGKKEKRADGKG